MACEQPTEMYNPRYKNMSNVELTKYSLNAYGICTPPDLYVKVPCGYCHSCQKHV